MTDCPSNERQLILKDKHDSQLPAIEEKKPKTINKIPTSSSFKEATLDVHEVGCNLFVKVWVRSWPKGGTTLDDDQIIDGKN